MNESASVQARAGINNLFGAGELPRAVNFKRGELLRSLAVGCDALQVVAGLLAGYWIRFHSGWVNLGKPEGLVLKDYLGLMAAGAGLLLITFAYLKLYDSRSFPRAQEARAIIFKGTTFWFFAFLSFTWVTQLRPVSRIYILISYGTCLTALLLWRWGFYALLRRPALAQAIRQRLLFVGWNEMADSISERVKSDPGHPYEVVGWIPAPMGRRDFVPPQTAYQLGDCSQLPEILSRHKVDVVVLADLGLSFTEIVGLANVCEKELVQFKIIPSYFQILLSGLKLEPISGVPVLGVSELPLDRPINRILKRLLDLAGAMVGLGMAVPITIVSGILIYLESPGPIFYKQVRAGRNGREFTIYKLRSMRMDAEKNGIKWATGDDPRCLRVGKFLRKWKLDEFPQFWNVLKGEMSLVGPRPERPELISKFRNQVPHYNARLSCKPGITGWAQVNGAQCNTNLEARIRYDLHYLEHWSLWFDVQTIFQTLFISRYNVY